MSRLIRLDRTDHTTLGEWSVDDQDSYRLAVAAFERERGRGMIGSATTGVGGSEVVRELPIDADLVVMRRQIAGG